MNTTDEHCDSNDYTTSKKLSFAARNNDVENVTRLLQKVKPNYSDDRGWTCLHEAASKDSYESIMLILKDPRIEGLAETHKGETALYLACENKCSLQTVRALLESVNDIANYSNNEEVTPLHIASTKGNVELIELLLQYGAMINVCNVKGFTPLHAAVINMHHAAVVALLYAGADTEITTEQSHGTAFYYACFIGCLPIVESFVDFVVDVNQQTRFGDTPLHLALQRLNNEIVYFLLDHGADPNIKNSQGELPLNLAVNASLELFKRLLSVTNMKKIHKDVILKAFMSFRYEFEILEILLTSDLGPEYYNFIMPFNIFVNVNWVTLSTYLINPPLNHYIDVSGSIYSQSPEKFKELFYIYLMQGVNINPLHALECPPLVYAIFVHLQEYSLDTTCFEEIFKILVAMGCDVDFCSSGKNLRNDVCISDAFRTAVDIYPYSALLMMPYSIYNEPDKYLQYAIETNQLCDVPKEVQNELLKLIDKNFNNIPAESIEHYVPCLKHLCRYRIRSILRNKTIKDNVMIKYTTSTFLDAINRLPVPQEIKHYLRYTNRVFQEHHKPCEINFARAAQHCSYHPEM